MIVLQSRVCPPILRVDDAEVLKKGNRIVLSAVDGDDKGEKDLVSKRFDSSEFVCFKSLLD